LPASSNKQRSPGFELAEDTIFNVNNGVSSSLDFFVCSTCHFLLAQKGAKTIVFEPARALAKKGYPECFRDPMLPPARPTRPSLGKEAIALFYWLVLRLIE